MLLIETTQGVCHKCEEGVRERLRGADGLWYCAVCVERYRIRTEAPYHSDRLAATVGVSWTDHFSARSQSSR